MGNCGAAAGTAEDKNRSEGSKRIDKFLNASKKQFAEEVKILLLGPGESGKSTVFKQCKILQVEGGYSDDERKTFASVCVHNIISQMVVLVQQAARLGHALHGDAAAAGEAVLNTPVTQTDSLSPALAAHIKTLWACPEIQATYEQRDKKFSLNDSAAYFFEPANVDRIASAGFVPSVDDVLRVRVRSTGIEEAEFDFDDLTFRMFDVGGQRSERRKWIHCFEKVTAVLFVISLCGYDQVLREDETQNCMKESILLFDEIVNSPWFERTNFILFLNKTDLFKEKIKTSPLSACFSDYSFAGKPDDEEEAAMNFIRGKFLAQKQGTSKEIFVHPTCAIDSKQIDAVFKSVRATLLSTVLAQSGVLYN